MNHADNQKIQEALTSCLSGVEALPSRRGEILRAVRGEKKVKRKMSKGLVLALVLMLMMGSVAVAAELGLFGLIGNQVDADVRLPALDAAATPVGQSFTTPDGTTVTINQAFYDGKRVFVSYTVAGKHQTVELGEGKPDIVNYDWQEPGETYAKAHADESAVGQQMAKWLDGSAERWAKKRHVWIPDSLEMADGTVLNIIGGGGEDIYQADGSYINWKECEVPADKAGEEIAVKLTLCTSENTWYQTADCLYRSYGGIVEKNEFVFTVKMDASVTKLAGVSKGAEWTGTAEASVNAIDMKGEITIECPQSWVEAWTSWENPEKADCIDEWKLYIDGAASDKENLYGTVDPNTAGMLRYGFCYQMDSLPEDMKLVPVYRYSGEHADEAIVLTIAK